MPSASGGGGGGSGDAADPSAPAGDSILAGTDVVMVALKGVDAYTRERIVEGLPASYLTPQRQEAFLAKVMQVSREIP